MFTKISAMFEPLPYHTGNAHTHTQTALLCSGFTFFTVAFVVFRLKITQPCVFCRSKGLLKCCPYVTHIHTYNTNIQKINCLHIHRYAYLYEHALFVYHPLNYCIHCYQQDLYIGTCSREWLQRMSISTNGPYIGGHLAFYFKLNFKHL